MSAKTGKRKERNEPSAEDQALEEFLFGKVASKTEDKNHDVDISFTIDTTAQKDVTAAWHDEDDDDIVVDLSKVDRLKKLKKDNSNLVSGTEFTNLLKERFVTSSESWANVAPIASAHENDDYDEDLDLLNQAGSMVTGGKKAVGSGHLPLPSGKINIQRVTNANIAEPSKNSITAVNFHSSGELMLAAGADKYMRFFKIDGDRNEKQLAVHFNDIAISNARFLGRSSEVVVSGRKPYFYSYDSVSGAISKINAPTNKNINSLEHMTVSPEGSKLAFLGSSGYIHIANGQSKGWMMDLKMNCSAKCVTFLDELNMVSSGRDADIYLWDLRMNGRCVSRFAHDDGSVTSSLCCYAPSLHPSSSRYDNNTLSSAYLAVGTESGVVSIFEGQRTRAGLFDFTGYAREQAAASATGAVKTANGSVVPKQIKTMMQLTTKITATAFHPTGQILAMSSYEKKDQFKLIHLPTNTVFSNWPTERTPFNRVECIDFSPGGGYMALGNNRGKVLLYKLNHFGTA